VDLEEDVAELVQQLGVVLRVGRRRELVGLLDGVRDDRALVLLAVPGTLAAQPPRERVEALDRGGGVCGIAQRGSGVGVPCPGCCGTAPGGACGVAVGFGAFWQSWVT